MRGKNKKYINRSAWIGLTWIYNIPLGIALATLTMRVLNERLNEPIIFRKGKQLETYNMQRFIYVLTSNSHDLHEN